MVFKKPGVKFETKIGSVISFLHLLCAFPFSWHTYSPHLRQTNSVRLLCWSFFMMASTIDGTYQMFILYSMAMSNPKILQRIPEDEVLLTIAHSASRSSALVTYFAVFYNFKESIAYLNRFLLVNSFYRTKYYGKNTEPHKYLWYFFLYCSLVIPVQPLGPALQYLQQRHSARFLGAYLPSNIYDSLPAIITFFFYDIILTLCCWAALLYLIIHLIVFTYCTGFWVKVANGKLKTPLNEVDSISSRLKLYQQLQILNKKHTLICSVLFWPLTQSLLIAIHVIINVTFIHSFSSNIELSYTMGTFVCLAGLIVFEKVCFKGAAKVYEESKHFKSELINNSEKYYRKLGKGLSCLKVQVSRSYFFKMSTFNTYAFLVVDYTINVLLVKSASSS